MHPYTGRVPRPSKDAVVSKRSVGLRLRAIREQRGLSQGKLAQLLRSHPQSVSQIERGVRGLTLQQAVRLARALKVSIDDVLGETKRELSPLSGDRRMLRRLQRLQELPPAQKKAVLKLIDGALGIGGGGAQ